MIIVGQKIIELLCWYNATQNLNNILSFDPKINRGQPQVKGNTCEVSSLYLKTSLSYHMETVQSSNS